MKDLFKRITCKYFGHCTHGWNSRLVFPPEKFRSDDWKHIFTDCARCKETHCATEFPVAWEIKRTMSAIMDKEVEARLQEMKQKLGL
jgi:hypothetical protein